MRHLIQLDKPQNIHTFLTQSIYKPKINNIKPIDFFAKIEKNRVLLQK